MNLYTIKAKINTISAVIAVLMIIQAIFMLSEADALKSTVSDISQVNNNIMAKSYDLRISVIQVQQWLTDISATRGKDGLNDGFDEAAKHADNVRRLAGELAGLDPEQADFYKEMLPTFENYYATGKKMAQSYIDEGPAGGNKMMGQFDAAAAAINETVSKLMEMSNSKTATTLASQDKQIKSIINWYSAISVAYLVGLALYLLLLYNIVLKPLCRLQKVTHDLVAEGKGDLTKRLEVKRETDEIGRISMDVNTLIEKLQDTMQTVDGNVEKINESVADLNQISHQTDQDIQIQLQDTEVVATAMNELMASSQEVSDNAQKTSESTVAASKQAQDGETIINRSVTSLTRLADDVRQAGDVINSLSEDSQNIGSVLDVIKGIAEQTNLLALNAAIEAARAGEQGRGFAVVADEVRTLASRTQESAEEINDMISRLQSRVREVTKVMGNSLEQAGESVSEGEQAKEALVSIRSSIDSINNMTQMIARAAHEQSTVTTNLDQNITGIADSAKRNTDNSTNVVNSSKHIEQLCDDLNAQLKKYKYN